MIAMLPISCLVIFFLFFGFSSLAHCHDYNEEGWKAASEYIKEAINIKADPCNDFYQYACGNWDKKYQGKYETESTRAIDDTIKQLQQALNAIRQDDPDTPTYQKRVQTFYKQCVNATEDPEEILNGIYDQLEKVLGPMPLITSRYNETNPYRLMGQMQHYFNAPILVMATVKKEKVGCGFGPILTLHPAKVITPYLKSQDEVSEGATVTEALMKMAKKRKTDTAAFTRQIETLSNLEMDILSIRGNSADSLEKYELANMTDSLYTNGTPTAGTWQDYFQGLLPSEGYEQWVSPPPARKGSAEKKSIRVAIDGISYFYQLDGLIQKYGARTLLDYAYWRAMNNYLNYFLETPRNYWNRDVSNETSEEECIEYVLTYASAAAANLLFQTQGFDAKDWKYDIELIVQALLSAFRYAIYNTDMIELEDKVSLMNMLKTIKVYSGVPKWLLNHKAVEEHTPAFIPSRNTFENDVQMFRQMFKLKMTYLWQQEPGDSKGDKVLVDAEPNFEPMLRFRDRIIDVTLGLLLPPLYNVSYPLALKFGSLGPMVAGQLMKAFDPDLSLLYRGLDLRNSLEQISLNAFKNRKDCFAKEMGPHRTKNHLYISIRQLEGIKLAYMAYAYMAQTVGREPPLANLPDYDADQLFFLSCARFICGGSPDYLDWYLAHFPAFAKAFKCTAGDRYFRPPNDTCSLWIEVTDTFIARRTEEN